MLSSPPSQRGAVNATSHEPLHEPSQEPVTSARQDPEQLPSQEPEQLPSMVPAQLPLQVPTGARKPYFIFGDAGNPVDLWFMDLSGTEPRQFTGKGSQDIAPNDTGDLQAVARYDEGEWSVVFKRPLRPATSGVALAPGQFVPVAFSVWDGFTRERGSRRALTVWYHLYVEPEVTVSPVGSMLKTAGAVLALEILVIVLVRRRSGRGGARSAASVRVQSSPSAS